MHQYSPINSIFTQFTNLSRTKGLFLSFALLLLLSCLKVVPFRRRQLDSVVLSTQSIHNMKMFFFLINSINMKPLCTLAHTNWNESIRMDTFDTNCKIYLLLMETNSILRALSNINNIDKGLSATPIFELIKEISEFIRFCVLFLCSFFLFISSHIRWTNN